MSFPRTISAYLTIHLPSPIPSHPESSSTYLPLQTEAPLNGYAFGKGIYLADCSSKSANYCMSSMSGGVGILLLVEAELSNPMYEIDTGDSNAEEMARKHNCIATKGVGKEVPEAWKDAGVISEELEGVMMVSLYSCLNPWSWLVSAAYDALHSALMDLC